MNWINHVLFAALKIKFCINPINSYMMQVKDIRMKELNPISNFTFPPWLWRFEKDS